MRAPLLPSPSPRARRLLCACLALLTAACTAEVEIQTEPVDQVLPVTSVGVPVYAEIAVDIPEEARGEIVVLDAQIDTDVLNASNNATVQLAAWLSLEGEATPEVPKLFTELTRPAYFAKAEELLEGETYAPQEKRHERVKGAVLDKALRQERVWFIFRNTVTNVTGGGGVPIVGGGGGSQDAIEIHLEDIIFRARLTKRFDELTGAQELGGL